MDSMRGMLRMGGNDMKKKTKAVMQILLMLVMAILFAFVPISYMQQVIRTNLATVEPSQLEQYVKKPIALDSEDYNIVSNIIMWERHQATSDELSGDYVTAFYPIKVYTKSGGDYIIAAEFDDSEKGSYIYSHAPIKGNILAVPAEHLEEYQEAIGDMNAYPYYISVDSSSDAENFWASFLCGFLSLLSATSAVLLIKMQMEGANN